MKKMKTGIRIGLCVMIAAALLAGCGKDAKSGSQSGTSSNPSTVALSGASSGTASLVDPTHFQMGGAGELGYAKITAQKIIKSAGSANTATPAQGNCFIGIEFTVENTGQAALSMKLASAFSTIVDGEQLYNSATATHYATARGETLMQGDIAPGQSQTGWFWIEIAQDFTKAEIEVQPDLEKPEYAVLTFEAGDVKAE